MEPNFEKARKLAHFVAQYIACDVKIDKAVRTPFDSIDANLKGGNYLNKNGGDYWLNRNALRQSQHRTLLLEDFQYVSPSARKILLSVDENSDLPTEVWLVCEHVVPCAFMEDLLREEHSKTPLNADRVLEFHSQFYRRCIVTKEEDRLIKPVKKMPKGWTIRDCVFERYKIFSWAENWI